MANESQNKPLALLLVNSKVRNISAIQTAVQSSVCLISYQHEAGLEGILAHISKELGVHKVRQIGIILHSTPVACSLCAGANGSGQILISLETVRTSQELRNFLVYLKKAFLGKHAHVRLDFLGCSTITNSSDENNSNNNNNVLNNTDEVSMEISSFLAIAVGVSKEIWGTDVLVKRVSELEGGGVLSVGELYFQSEKLRSMSANSHQSMAAFEKIRTVGKGAYGTAVLYRKKDDDSLVILKEINMHDLTANERQLAMNEVKVLSMLDHPNIISYFDSFDEDGILMIEMEYADGGTLSQMLARQEKLMLEKEVLSLFQQIVSAIHYIHEHKVLHRDLKTANIFLTKEGVVKIGDFGIAKMLSTSRQGASTVLGTPYYISPEMCEGKPYNEKSDIWALGCILYELACLQKTFEGSNLPALVNKIMKGQFAPVTEDYSEGFRDLVNSMLQRDPLERPKAEEILYKKLPELMLPFEDPTTDVEDELSSSQDNRCPLSARPKRGHLDRRSVLYHMELTTLTLTPYSLPSKVRLRSVSAGSQHIVAISSERAVYAWGENASGQLGHGDLIGRSRPEPVDSLKGKSISKVSCGSSFTVFGSDNGIVMTCGDGSTGCLGHGDWYCAAKPRLIESLLSVDVICLTCGPSHVLVVSSDGEVYSWGRGRDGRTGLGDTADRCAPVAVKISEPVHIRSVYAGTDGSMLLTDAGAVFATGLNKNNKLALNHRVGFLMAMKNMFNKLDVEGTRVFTPVRALARHKVINLAMGADHTAVVVEPGHVITFGRNREGQLGVGNSKPQSGILEVKALHDLTVNRVQCGYRYTVASTSKNELFLWGRRIKPASSSVQSDDDDNDSVRSADSNEPRRRSDSGELHLQPVHILKLNNPGCGTRHSPPDRELVTLGVFVTYRENLLVQVETTAPPPRRRYSRRATLRRRVTPEQLATMPASESAAKIIPAISSTSVTSGRGTGEDASSETSDAENGMADTLGTIPRWLRQELADSPNLPSSPISAPNPLVLVSSSSSTDLKNVGNEHETLPVAVVSSSELETTSSSVSTSSRFPQPTASHQKPLNKMRQQNKGRTPMRRSKEKEKEHQQIAAAAQIKSQVDVLREQKAQAESRLHALERIHQDGRQEALERESRLRNEITAMRDELGRQNQMMRENHNVVLSLQEQLFRVQSESRSPRDSNADEKAKSRICVIQ